MLSSERRHLAERGDLVRERRARCRAPCQICPLSAYLGDLNRLLWVWLRGEHRVCQAKQERRFPHCIFRQDAHCSGSNPPLIPWRERPQMLPAWFHYAGAELKLLERPFPSTAAWKTSWCVFTPFPPQTAKQQGPFVQNAFKDLTQLLRCAPWGGGSKSCKDENDAKNY